MDESVKQPLMIRITVFAALTPDCFFSDPESQRARDFLRSLRAEADNGEDRS